MENDAKMAKKAFEDQLVKVLDEMGEEAKTLAWFAENSFRREDQRQAA